jgi:hypothetical protein
VQAETDRKITQRHSSHRCSASPRPPATAQAPADWGPVSVNLEDVAYPHAVSIPQPAGSVSDGPNEKPMTLRIRMFAAILSLPAAAERRRKRQRYDVAPHSQRFVMIRTSGANESGLVYAEHWFGELLSRLER